MPVEELGTSQHLENNVPLIVTKPLILINSPGHGEENPESVCKPLT